MFHKWQIFLHFSKLWTSYRNTCKISVRNIYRLLSIPRQFVIDMLISKEWYSLWYESSSTNQDAIQKTMQIADLEEKNKFWHLLQIDQNNPLCIDSYAVWQSQDFMDLVKLLIKKSWFDSEWLFSLWWMWCWFEVDLFRGY